MATRKPAAGAPQEDFSPERYVAKVHRRTGKEVPFEPDELLIHAHRDTSPIQVTAEFLAGRLMRVTKSEEKVRDVMRTITIAANKAASALGSATGSRTLETQARRLAGMADRDYYFRFRETTHLTDREVKARIERLQKDARAALKARGRSPRLHVLLTGATGFLGKEILSQAAEDRRIADVVAVVRPEKIRDPRTKEVVKVLSPGERGALLLKRLGLRPSLMKKFRFIEGDIEKPNLGIAPAELGRLKRTLTHVIHCAASVSFDDTYENSFRANVLGCRNALDFALMIQRAEGSHFVHHIAIETSYIHGRKKRSMASEHALVFPRHYYNNFYELTKAMASIETDRCMIDHGLRVAQLLPAIVIGDSHTGNNRGDTKVVNAPINAFGRSKEVAQQADVDTAGRIRAYLIGLVAHSFPGDPSAELNLVPVDRVVRGILAGLTVPEAIGARIHLATDNRIRSEDVARIAREELGVNVRLADPTLFRNFTLPIVKRVLEQLNEPKLANALERLGSIFGSYGEWGQPIHEVGNDVRLLGLPIHRPDTQHAFRMLCRHNKYVQEFGKVRDQDEIARREKAWQEAVDAIELRTGREAGMIGPEEFRKLLEEELDLRTFKRRKRKPRPEDEA